MRKPFMSLLKDSRAARNPHPKPCVDSVSSSSDSGEAFIEWSQERIPYTIISSSKQLKDKFWAVHMWHPWALLSYTVCPIALPAFSLSMKTFSITLQKHLSLCAIVGTWAPNFGVFCSLCRYIFISLEMPLLIFIKFQLYKNLTKLEKVELIHACVL